MEKYVCKKCKNICYSAATSVNTMIESYCPYCGGEIEKVEDRDKNE